MSWWMWLIIAVSWLMWSCVVSFLGQYVHSYVQPEGLTPYHELRRMVPESYLLFWARVVLGPVTIATDLALMMLGRMFGLGDYMPWLKS